MEGLGLAGQAGFFNTKAHLRWLSASGDPLERLRAAVVDFEASGGAGDFAAKRGPQPPRPAVPLTPCWYSASRAAVTLYVTRRADRVPAARSALVVALRGPGAARCSARRPKTIWLYRVILTRAGALTRLFARFEAMLAERGFRQGDGEIVDATVVEARRPRPRCPLDRQVRPQGQAARGWAPGVPPNGVHERPATRLFEASDCLRSPPSGLRL